MNRVNLLVVLLVSLCVPYAIQAAEAPKSIKPKVTVTPASPGPGDIVIVTVKGLPGPLEGKFGDKKIYFNTANGVFTAVIGVDLNAEPGKINLVVSSNGTDISREVTIKKKKYPVQKLKLPNDMVELSPENEARADREQLKVAALWPHETGRVWNGSFMNPRKGEIVTKFGMRRIINGIPKNSHSGVDVAAEEGAKVYAPNNAIVTLVDNHFFSGNSVILDHGQGIFTMFFHLSKILVKEGQPVNKGKVIGLIGSTGRSTGAHLHWGVRMQGARVDPLELINLKLE